MAKLNAYYGLCPLIDQKNLLGISDDAEPGHVIVTLGKNIAVKYRLSDQKQIQSWRTKDKFTSPVVFANEETKYISVFNQVNLRLWTKDDIEHLDKIKKCKFNKPIHTVINCNKRTFVVFKNGNVLTLKDALEQRKDLDVEDIIDTKNEEIIDVIYTYLEDIVYVGLIVNAKSMINCIVMSLSENLPRNYHTIKLKRAKCTLSGYTFCEMSNKYLYFLTLWDDGQLYSCPITERSNSMLEPNDTEEFGSSFATIESVSCKQCVAMTALASDHIAIYGADCNQEGASLLIYNTQFKISQSKQSFKMFSNTIKIWSIENTLLLCSGQNLAVVPFHINTEQLSELIGSHRIDFNDADIQQTFTVGIWDIENDSDYSKSIPRKIRKSVLNCLGQGISEVTVCNHLIPVYIKNSDVEAIENCLDYFKDISEACLVKIVAFLIRYQLSFDISQIPKRNLLIDKVLSLPSTDTLLLPHIKVHLDISTTLQLLKYICFLLSSEECLPALDFVQSESKLVKWGCAVLDGNYQKLLLTRDATVSEVLKNFYTLVQEHLLCLCDLKTVEPVIENLISKKCIFNNKQSNVKYSVEDVKLY